MDSREPLAPPGEPPDITGLRARSAELQRDVHALGSAEPGTVQHLPGLGALVLQLRRIAPAATRSVLVLLPQYAYDPEDPTVPLAHNARLRGVETTLITSPATVRTHPLLSSIFPSTLRGPVFLRALLIDGRQAVVGGPDDATGQRTSWYTTAPAIVAAVADLWHATALVSEPILAPREQPPFDQRQLEVARLLCVGEEDDEIAQRLRLPKETVNREVETLLVSLAARNRSEAVLNMRGRGVNGGRGAYAPGLQGYAGAR